MQFGLSGTVASLLALSVGLFLLRPLPLEQETATEASSLTEEEQKQLERLMGKLADAASPDRPLW